MNIEIDIKPLSVNLCWQGKRYKTKEYKIYEQILYLKLPNKKLPKPPYFIIFEFGFSNKGSDYDNPVKPLQDILQKKYGFDDKNIYKCEITKKLVKKGCEYFSVYIGSTGVDNSLYKKYLIKKYSL